MRLSAFCYILPRGCALAAAVWSVSASACAVANLPSPDPDFGTYSPAAIKAGAVPAGTVAGGINCSGTVISLLGGNVLIGTLGSTNGYQMLPVSGGDAVTFKVYVDQAATKQMSTTAATNFLNPAVIDLLGLLGGSPSNIPLYVKVASANPVPTGNYAGTFTVAWAWKLCSGVWVGSTCTLGTLKQGSATATIKFTMTVAAKPVTVSLTSVTTWDPVSGTVRPRDLPSSKRRATITLNNPDIVSVDAASLNVLLPTPARSVIALDGDGTGAAVLQFNGGSSSVTLSYGGSSATNDNVDFSSDNGATFAYLPVAGNPASQGAVTTVRFRPQGSMAPGSSFTVSLPYSVR